MNLSPVYLFLGFDDVLHPRGQDVTARFTHADRLGKLLADYPYVIVVVSSSWRDAHGLDELRAFCGPLLGPRLRDVTPTVKLVLGGRPVFHRFREIAFWLATHPKPPADLRDPAAEALRRGDWMALDANAAWFPPGCRQLIYVKEGRGLGDHYLAELATRLLEQRRSATGRPQS